MLLPIIRELTLAKKKNLRQKSQLRRFAHFSPGRARDFDGYQEATLGLGHGFEDECAGEPSARSDDGDDDLSYLSSDDAASLADSALA